MNKSLLVIGLVLEIIIFVVSYLLHPSMEDTFRYAARYSGRLSLLVFIYTFYLYAISYSKPLEKDGQVKSFVRLFAFLHVIHFGFLAMSVYLNSIPLETVKVIGGALAYLMIVVAPFKLHLVRPRFQLIYFYYVSFVMIMTYVARLKGELEGAEPYWIHYLGLGLMLFCCVLFGGIIYRSSKLESK